MLRQSLLSTFKNNKIIETQAKLTKTFFGFDPEVASHKNLNHLHNLLGQGTEALLPHIVEEKQIPFFSKFNFSNRLTTAENSIFQRLSKSFTLRHATNAITKIKEQKKMEAVRTLEKNGVIAARHTMATAGIDESIYFTLGIGKHRTPEFVDEATHTIVVDLDRMQNTDPLATKRLWVSGHLSEFQAETRYSSILGNVKFSVKHAKDRTKVYSFKYPNGQELQWNLSYQDEIFTGNDVIPGIALQFIYLLRLLGGEHNPLVKKLYQATNQENFTPLMEKIFSAVLMGWVYPEAKIIQFLDLNEAYVSVEKNKTRYEKCVSPEFSAVRAAVKAGNLITLQALLKSKFNCQVDEDNLIATAIDSIKDQNLRIKILTLLIQYGVNPLRGKHRFDTVLYHVIMSGSAIDLDFLLSQEYADIDEPLIKHRASANKRLRIGGINFDYIETACACDFTGEKLLVLKKHGADFSINSDIYLKATMAIGYPPKNNYAALRILCENGAVADSEDEINETPLMKACRLGDDAIVKYLVNTIYVNVNARLKFYRHSLLAGKTFHDDPAEGKTALHFAAEGGHTQIVSYLLTVGADSSLRTIAGETAYDLIPAGPDHSELRRILHHYPSLTTDMRLEDSNEIKATEQNDKRMRLKEAPKMSHQMVAMMVVGRRQDGQPYVILGKRRPAEDDKRPHYCFPGGSADENDASLKEAAIREFLEETSVDLNQLQEITITDLGTFTGFSSETHHSTTFFMADIGKSRIHLHPCDDLLDVKQIALDQIEVKESLAPSKLMRHENNPIQGSNALFIKRFAMMDEKCQPSDVTEQLKVEEDGHELLLDAIKEKNWMRVQVLLQNEAHLAPHSRNRLVHRMIAADHIEGLNWLKQHGVDFTDESDFTIDNKPDYGSALLYVTKLGRLDMAQKLIELEPQLSKDTMMSPILLNQASSRGFGDLFDFHLNNGLNPNTSHNDTTLGGCFSYPNIATAIKKDQLAMMRQLLAEPRVYLNRERSPKDRDSTLMTAISHDKPEAALTLLATCRLNLRYSAAPTKTFGLEEKSDPTKTAHHFAVAKGYRNIASVIEFQLQYQDMNHFLNQNNLPAMEGYLHTVDENNKPTIHFIHSDRENLQAVLRHAHSAAEIKATLDNRYYIRMGKVRLTNLCGNKDVAEYLLQYTTQSMFWAIRSTPIRLLHTALVENTIKEFEAEIIDLQGSFETLENKPFYTQLIRENSSLETLNLNLSHKNPACLHWVLATMMGHDKIRRVTLSNPRNIIENLNATIDCINSLPNLEEIHANGISLRAMEDLLHYVSQLPANKQVALHFHNMNDGIYHESALKKAEKLNIKNEIYFIGAERNYQLLLSNTITENQRVHYYNTNTEFKESADELKAFPSSAMYAQSRASRNRESDPVQGKLLNKLQFIGATPKVLQVSDELFSHSAHEIRDLVESKNTLESVTISLKSPDNMISFLQMLATEETRLKFLSINYCTMNDASVRLLITAIQRMKIKMVEFTYLNLKEVSPVLISLLGEALANNPSILTIELSSMKVKNDAATEAFLTALSASTSLVLVERDYFSTLKASPSIDRLEKKMQQNAKALLQRLSMSSNVENNSRLMTFGNSLMEHTTIPGGPSISKRGFGV